MSLLVIFCVSAAVAQAPALEESGVLVMDATVPSRTEHWKPRNYHSGKGLVSDGEGWVEFEASVNKPGRYAFFLLGCATGRFESNQLQLRWRASDSAEYHDAGAFSLQPLRTPAWTLEPVWVELPASGLVRFRLEAAKGIFVQKLVARIDGKPPTGMGPLAAGTPDFGVVLPPAWAFGVLYGGYTDQAQTVASVDRLIAGDFPVDAYWIDSWFWSFQDKGRGPAGYLSFRPDSTAFPDVKTMWEQLGQRKVKGGVWIWDYLLRRGNEEVFDNFQKRGYFSSTFTESGRWHNDGRPTLAGNIDFNNPEAVRYWKHQLLPLFDQGLDFLKLDRSSDLAYCRSAFEASQELGKETKGRGFILAHLHTLYDPRHKLYPTRWTGDAKICWDQVDFPNFSQYAMGGYRQNVAMVSNPSLSTYEAPFLTHDTGGYNYFGSQEQSEELYCRWVQFASMNTVMTLFSTADNPTRNHPYNYSPRGQAVFRKYTHLRMSLFPYIYSYALRTRLEGVKMIRGDSRYSDQYLFGEELLVAPVVQEGAGGRQVFLPKGRWYDYETDKLYEGGRMVEIEAPLEKLPILVREGAILPTRDYARAVELGNNGRLTLDVYPGPSASHFTLLEDDGTSNDYLSGGFAATVIEMVGKKLYVRPMLGHYRGALKSRRWVVRFHRVARPSEVRVNGEKTPFEYESKSSLVIVEVQSPTDRMLEVDAG